MKITINCANCNKELLKWKSQIRKSGNGYCSPSCSISYRNKYEYNPSHHRDLSGEKNPMYGKGYRIQGEKNGMYGRKGERHPNFRGGFYQRKDGYIRLLVNGERVLQHRKVLIDAGIDIDGMVVHHKNGIKWDNRLENLEVITQSDHINQHREELNAARGI
jgi:hypothetical protein